MQDRFFKKIYSIGDFYWSLVLSFRGMEYLKLNKEKKLVSNQFKERIMLAVTEVNGCEACSYAHTKFALEEGMSQEEISSILSGEMGVIPEEETVAIFFAQHYTDQNGKSSKESWQRLVDEYGFEKSMVILAIIRMMISGNIYGIAVSAMQTRLKGKPSGKTSLFYEITMLISFILYLPLAAIHASIENRNNVSLLPY